ncbi:MAG: sulfatase [Saprospiraceae bacterium]
MRILASFLFLSFFTILLPAQNQPNILWIVTEDNSKHYLKLYEENGVAMPAIEQLAKSGLVFNHCFSQGPVCSVARSTIISGTYAPRTGAQFHRAEKKVPMPNGLKMFPAYLRQAGYYTTNNSKEDYNFFKSDDVWDESSRQATYQNRKEGQPFFHVQNFGITHEGQLHFNAEAMQNQSTDADPKKMKPHPYHPNTTTFRYTQAKYHDLHTKADQAIAKLLQQVQEEGLMEDTFIFYYGDHGGVLPGSKGYIYERGVHVPLVVHIPEKWKHLVPFKAGSRVDGFVNFIDLAPTILNLANVKIPDEMDGQAFLGKGISKRTVNKRKTSFSHADRFDEKYDLVRAIRVGKYKYIRNYQSYNIDGLHNFYRYRMQAYQEWRNLYYAGQLNPTQAAFFKPRQAEALYNIEEDPFEINNLIHAKKEKRIAKKLRKNLEKQLKVLPDLSFFPESYLLENAWNNPVKFGQQNKATIAELIEIANLSLSPFKHIEIALNEALESKNPWKRYWGLIVCSSFGEEAAVLGNKALKMALQDEENLVRMRAAEFLGLTKTANPSFILTDCLKAAQTATEANLVLNTIALLHDLEFNYKFELSTDLVQEQWLESRGSLIKERLKYLGLEIK